MFVKDDVVVATGYAGSPRGYPNCDDLGACLRDQLGVPHAEKYELCQSVHAETNCVINCARIGVNAKGSRVYIYGISGSGKIAKVEDMYPCFMDTKIMLNLDCQDMIHLGWDVDGVSMHRWVSLKDVHEYWINRMSNVKVC